MYKSLHGYTVSFILVRNPELDLLYYMLFWYKVDKLFSKAVAPFYNPISKYESSNYSTTLRKLGVITFLILAILMGV